MARRTTIRVTQKTLAQDREVAKAVLGLKDYNPANKEFTVVKLQEALKNVEAAILAEQSAQEAAAKARDEAIAIENSFHDLVLGVKRQVIAQYGDDSDEIAKLGMKKKSERRYGRPRKDLQAE
ncbi:MAG: hypothetical protein FGM32_05135 [Candidatus Kapabacteria bacterium]|nr:hypothetical protein [Candidatus Kapabacteria bacterium]